MTTKRFTFHHDVDGVDYIEDESNGVCLICDELMCSLLNELYEENQDLKSFNQDLSEELSVCGNARISKDDWIETLTEENEQLKKDVKYWKQVASQYSNELNVFEHCKRYKTECKDIHWSSD